MASQLDLWFNALVMCLAALHQSGTVLRLTLNSMMWTSQPMKARMLFCNCGLEPDLRAACHLALNSITAWSLVTHYAPQSVVGLACNMLMHHVY